MKDSTTISRRLEPFEPPSAQDAFRRGHARVGGFDSGGLR